MTTGPPEIYRCPAGYAVQARSSSCQARFIQIEWLIWNQIQVHESNWDWDYVSHARLATLTC